MRAPARGCNGAPTASEGGARWAVCPPGRSTAGKAWTRLAGGPGNAAAVAVNPKKPDEVYAVTVDGNLYRSADGGREWDESR